MTTARAETVIKGVEGLYHCICRCVRRAFLCGWDQYSGRSYEHRKEWIRSRLEHLAAVFAIEVCAYAIMSNHLHIVLRTRPDWVEAWEDEEVVLRWTKVFPQKKSEKKQAEDKTEGGSQPQKIPPERLALWRSRLGNVSWFMRCLNEVIARQANKEDNCKGRFWEGRFKCQVLLDESAVLACMAYVDLNPIRAGLTDRPEKSEYTSVYDRIKSRELRSKQTKPSMTDPNASDYLTSLTEARASSSTFPDDWLCPLGADSFGNQVGFLSFSTDEYLDLVDWTGRQLRADKPGSIPDHLSPIMVRLGIDTDRWTDTVAGYGRRFHRVAGRVGSILNAARQLGRKWLSGMSAGRLAFSPV